MKGQPAGQTSGVTHSGLTKDRDLPYGPTGSGGHEPAPGPCAVGHASQAVEPEALAKLPAGQGSQSSVPDALA